MRYEVTAQQRKSFDESEEILFEEFLSDAERDHINALQGGEELWRTDPLLQKLFTSNKIADLFWQLKDLQKLRLVFDIVTPPGYTLSLSELPIQGLIGGIIIEKGEHSATFFTGTAPLKIASPSYVVLYGELNSLYVEKKHSPFAYRLKKQGYVYGDRLKPEDFPTLR